MKINLFQYDITTCSPQWEVLEKGAVYHRLYYVYDGDARVSEKGEWAVLQRCHLYLFPISKPYHILHDPQNPLRCLWFHIAFFPPVINGIVKQPVPKGTALYYLVKTLECLVDEGERDKELLEQLLENLSALISRNVGLQYTNDERLEKVLSYIHNHFGDHLTNDILAEQAQLNRGYFIRLFKNHFGISPQRYVLNYRMGQACLLLQENIPVVEVAARVGYQDSKAFSRAFRNSLGLPPSEYGKRHSLQP